MNITVLGMGYVGTVMSAILADEGHIVWGVDINREKISFLKKGILPFTEPKLNTILNNVIKNKTLLPTIDLDKALFNSEVIFICVGTPNNDNGDLNLSYLKETFKNISHYYENNFSNKKVNIIIRSTIRPGTIKKLIIKYSNLNNQYHIFMNPEFLREGSAVDDFYNIDVIVGCINKKPNQIFMIWPEFLDDQGKVITTKESRVPSSGKAQMWIVNQEMTKYHQGRIYIGLEGFFMEGGTRVAQCQVTEIVGLKEPDNIKKK